MVPWPILGFCDTSICAQTPMGYFRLAVGTCNKGCHIVFGPLGFLKGPLLETFRFSTISKVEYYTTIGNNMIVFQGGMTSLFNKRVHGGEIALRFWFGFEKYIHVNRAGLVQEGRYPESWCRKAMSLIDGHIKTEFPTMRRRWTTGGDDRFWIVATKSMEVRCLQKAFFSMKGWNHRFWQTKFYWDALNKSQVATFLW